MTDSFDRKTPVRFRFVARFGLAVLPEDLALSFLTDRLNKIETSLVLACAPNLFRSEPA
jgi:hypothetical protein